MPGLGCGRDGPPERITDSLVAEAHAEQRHPGCCDYRSADTEVGRAIWAPGARRDHHAVDVRQVRGAPAGVVVADHDRTNPRQLREALDEVVGERVVVVDDEHTNIAVSQNPLRSDSVVGQRPYHAAQTTWHVPSADGWRRRVRLRPEWPARAHGRETRRRLPASSRQADRARRRET